MKYSVVAPVAEHIDNLYLGLKDFQAQRVYLITGVDHLNTAEKAKIKLESDGVMVIIRQIEGNIWESLFEEISKISETEKGENILVNTSSGNEHLQCAATSAAFVNGLKAISIGMGKAMILPVLKFNYYKILTDKKMDLLKELERGACNSLEELGNKVKMSLPLVSYHVNGNLKSEGLKQLGVVDTREEGGRIHIELSVLGRMLLRGYVSHE